jgi:hypothetical protein
LATEGKILFLRLYVVFLMLPDFDVHLLSRRDIHDAQWRSALSDAVQDLCVPGVIRAVEVAIVDAKAIIPEVQNSVDSLPTSRTLWFW